MRDCKQSPCLTCVRVDNPDACENKTCKEWKRWFLGRWELIHRYANTQQNRNS
ncbi:MAG: hypothetical protein IJB47_03225 [Oscillospiraceae bacterium]|nr:hypothetical protein [Oscillospiraceae bacterium]